MSYDDHCARVDSFPCFQDVSTLSLMVLAARNHYSGRTLLVLEMKIHLHGYIRILATHDEGISG